jgi:hypothetical protein
MGSGMSAPYKTGRDNVRGSTKTVNIDPMPVHGPCRD